MSSKHNNYNFVAYFYDILAKIYSGGQIYACKAYQAQHIKAQQKILFAGAGSADDAILAAQQGAEVTVVELSENMLKNAQKKIERSGMGASIKLIHGDVLQHSIAVDEQGNSKAYDIVAANFFLNVFDAQMMPSMFHHLASLLKADGYFYIADFSPGSDNSALKFLQYVYFGLAMMAFVLTANNAIHPLYDYQTLLEKNGFIIQKNKNLKLLNLLPFYNVIIAKKAMHKLS